MPRTPSDPTKAQVWIDQTGPELDFEFYIPAGSKGDPGGFTSTVVAANTDLDLLLTEGLYQCTIGTDANASALAHLPMHEAGSLMITKSGNNSVQIQTYITNTKSIYVRRRFSGAWGPWRAFTPSRTDLTAGRAMYTWDEQNQREQLTYGDTGWRNVTADLLNGYTGNVYLRRIGYTVFCEGTPTPPDPMVSGDFYQVPVPFQWTSLQNVRFNSRMAGSLDPFWLVRKGPTLPLSVENINGSWAPARGGFAFATSWATANAWPTTLPGTAVGAVPSA